MRGSDLSVAQLQALRHTLRPKLAYLAKLRSRMEINQFPKQDRLYRDTLLAHETMNDLLMEIDTLLNYRAKTPDPFR